VGLIGISRVKIGVVEGVNGSFCLISRLALINSLTRIQEKPG
jgi:hypothetical protein